MSDPNTPRAEGVDPAEQPADGFAVTDEQHATPSAPAAPAAPGVGEPAQSFSSAPVAPEPAPGQPAFSAGEGDQSWQQNQQPGAADAASGSAPAYGQGGAPGYGQPGQAQGGQAQGGQAQGGQAPHAQHGQHGQPQQGQPGQPQYGAAGQPQYGQPGQPQYGAPGQPQYGGASPMSPVDEKNAGMWGHLSGLSTIVTGGYGGWIGPLIVFLIYKDRSAFARQESKEALNFGILMTIAAVGLLVLGTILSIVGIGLILLALWWIPGLLQVIFSIIGAMRVNGGGSYRYPFNWRIVK
ncbi:DUF4870 domain-containing protein [Agrococcus sp. ProA11]|uniref:DUF4870 domain-containing protein n=1 Tax=Agrococcus chionoecetis TaxID=3153752 RepID=UPI0032604500